MSFVRVLIVIFCLTLSIMVGFKFFYVEPIGEISGELVTVLLIILVLVLSESFDNFSVGQLLQVNRKLEEKSQINKELKSENTDLRNQLINISANFSQRQSSTNIIGMPNIADLFMVQKADANEVTAVKEDESATPQKPPRAAPNKTLNMSEVEKYAIQHFVKANKLEQFSLINDAKLSTHFFGIDPIAITTPIFDGYINTSESEIFIEVRPFHTAQMMYRDRLYLMLTKLMHYKEAKKTNVYLNLIMVKIPGYDGMFSTSATDVFRRDFEPAITSGLLRLIVLEPSAEEAQHMLIDRT
jgi:hypothetical protein